MFLLRNTLDVDILTRRWAHCARNPRAPPVLDAFALKRRSPQRKAQFSKPLERRYGRSKSDGTQMDAAVIKRRPRFTADGIELPRTDGRTRASMRFKALVESLSAPFGGTLPDHVASMICQTAFMQLRAEQDGERLLAGYDVDPDQMGRTSSAIRRNIETLEELAARSKPAPENALQRYLAEKAAEQVVDDDVEDSAEAQDAVGDLEAPAELMAAPEANTP